MSTREASPPDAGEAGARRQEEGRGASTVFVDGVADWLMSQALGERGVDDIVRGCCDRLLAAGLPLARAFASFRTLHPLFASQSIIWRRDRRTGSIERLEHLHGEAFNNEQWRRSPMVHMLETQISFLRRRLTGPGALVDFPVCEDLRDQGMTDYFAYLVPFASDDEPGPHRDGVIGSWATDRASGFTDGDIRALQRIQRRLGVSLKVQIKQQIARNVLGTYLGLNAGEQVLNGLIKRGDGTDLHAVIWLSDMRDSTRLADELGAGEFLATVNEYFECTAGAVLAHGGEVLRFIGDAVLAIFPIVRDTGNGAAARAACARALDAAAEAERRLGELNATRARAGREAIDYGLGLHVGDVMFGNIGVPERLEFSVIGAAANEAARLEALTKSLGRRTLASAAFAAALPGAWESLGAHPLRGVGAPMEVYAPPT
ncbi:MAG: adenylate/guanylate cyclase domain-containing protein [Gammaproteobacteria bacterium]|nr:adenylate/guanylate cyclase domain-containing protein [Gammaproteobacteria bacterium]